MSDFNDRPLVVGTINGLRHFRIDALGRLTAVSHKSAPPWTPGMNEAACEKGTVAARNCQCGFYGFFDDRNKGNYALGSVKGIIRAQGRVTVGTLGFRAEKAEIVALISRGRLRSARFRVYCVVVPWLLVVAALVYLAFLTGTWPWITAACVVGGLSALFLGLFVTLATIDDEWDTVLPSGHIPAPTRQLYPDIPVFHSVREATRKFPLIQPEPPTPETDPDFWTRSAS